VANEGKMPRTYSYNLTVQRQIPAGTLLSFAYVGNQSSNLVRWQNTNPMPWNSGTGQNWPGQWMDQQYRQYQNIAGIYPAAHILRSDDNSLQLTASRGKGMLNYWVSCTFSKGLGQNSADAFDLSRAYGALPWDRTQTLKIAYNLTLPSVSRCLHRKDFGDRGASTQWKPLGTRSRQANANILITREPAAREWISRPVVLPCLDPGKADRSLAR
jgi:hypothetical protein